MQNLGTLQYTMFGRVSAGMSVIDGVAAGGEDGSNTLGDGAPNLKLEIDSIKQKP